MHETPDLPGEIYDPIEEEEVQEVILDFCFSLTTTKLVEELTGAELRAALLNRLNNMADDELTEACGVVDIMTSSN